MNDLQIKMRKTIFSHIQNQKAIRFTRSAVKKLQQTKKTFHVNDKKHIEHFCSVPIHVRICGLPKQLEDTTLGMNHCSKNFLKKRVVVDSANPTVTLFVKKKDALQEKDVQGNKMNANSDVTNSSSNVDVIEIPDDVLLLESIDSDEDDVVIVESNVITLDDSIMSVDSQVSQESDNANNNKNESVNIKMDDSDDIIFVKEEIPIEKKLINAANLDINQSNKPKMQAQCSNPVKHDPINHNKINKNRIKRLNRKLNSKLQKISLKYAHKRLKKIRNPDVPSNNDRQNSNFPHFFPLTNTARAAAPNNTNVSLSFMDFQNNMCSIIPKKKTGLREIVIDGSNVAMGHSNSRFFSVKGLQIAIEYFVKKGHKVVALVPHYRKKFNQTSDPLLLRRLEEKGFVVFTPSREVNGKRITPYDDRYILQYASACEGIVVSGDNYRDLFLEKPEWRETIEKRLLMPTWIRDCLIFPEDPLGRTGPSLDAFLKFPE